MGPSGLITAKARQGFIQMGIRWWVSGGPGHRSLQGCRGSGFVQPALIVWNHCGGANDPDTRLGLFHQNMAAGILLAYRDLAIAANELDGGRLERGSHGKPYTPQASGGRARWWERRTGRRLTGARGAKRHQRKEPRQDAKVLNITLNNLKREG